jgi:hypothetical protein
MGSLNFIIELTSEFARYEVGSFSTQKVYPLILVFTTKLLLSHIIFYPLCDRFRFDPSPHFNQKIS